jgi:hypothetical protein
MIGSSHGSSPTTLEGHDSGRVLFSPFGAMIRVRATVPRAQRSAEARRIRKWIIYSYSSKASTAQPVRWWNQEALFGVPLNCGSIRLLNFLGTLYSSLRIEYLARFWRASPFESFANLCLARFRYFVVHEVVVLRENFSFGLAVESQKHHGSGLSLLTLRDDMVVQLIQQLPVLVVGQGSSTPIVEVFDRVDDPS